MSDQPILSTRKLAKRFATPSGELTVFEDIDLQLERGESLVVVGTSGCGKSTLLHCIGTLLEPSEGELLIGGTRPFELSESELANFRNRSIGFLFQDSFLLPQLTAYENVCVPVLATRSIVDSDRQWADELLARVGVADRAHHHPSQLSGGQRARVALARALVLRPDLLLADEPTGALDPYTAGQIADLLLELQAEWRLSLIMVTHSQDLANRFEDRFDLGRHRIEQLASQSQAIAN